MTNANLINALCYTLIYMNDEHKRLTSELVKAKEDVSDLKAQAKTISRFMGNLQRVYNLEDCPFCHHPVTYQKDEVTGLYTCPNCLAV